MNVQRNFNKKMSELGALPELNAILRIPYYTLKESTIPYFRAGVIV
ncbi:hypothetical protein [Parabacteroides pacaensis]|nr:hypothetical protein [Parabacteroides pacaensis]